MQYWHARAACSRAAASRKSSRRAATHSSAGVPSGGGAAAAARSAADGGAPVAASSGERARRAAAGSAAEAVAGRARGCGREGKKEMRAARECASAPRWGCARVFSSLSLSLSLNFPSLPYNNSRRRWTGSAACGPGRSCGRRWEEGGRRRKKCEKRAVGAWRGLCAPFLSLRARQRSPPQAKEVGHIGCDRHLERAPGEVRAFACVARVFSCERERPRTQLKSGKTRAGRPTPFFFSSCQRQGTPPWTTTPSFPSTRRPGPTASPPTWPVWVSVR